MIRVNHQKKRMIPYNLNGPIEQFTLRVVEKTIVVVMVESELHLPDKALECVLETAVVGFSAALGVSPQAFDVVDMVLPPGELFLVVDAPVVKTVRHSPVSRPLGVSPQLVGRITNLFMPI